MSKPRASLAQLFAQLDQKKESGKQSAESQDSQSETKTEETTEESEEESEQEESEQQTEESEDKKADKSDDKSATDEDSVVLSSADFEKLTTYAGEVVQLRADNAALKVKAKKWDAYQAAVKGSKPSSDTTDKTESKPQSEHEQLKAKHGALMEGL